MRCGQNLVTAPRNDIIAKICESPIVCMVCSRFYGMVFGIVFVASPLSVCMVSCKFDSLDAHSKTAYVHERKFEGTSHVCMGIS